MKTVTLYDEKSEAIIVNVCDVKAYKDKGFTEEMPESGADDKPKSKKDGKNGDKA